MSEAIRYNATKVVGEYGSVARLQHRLHLAPDPKGKWVKWEDYAFLKMEVERLTKAGDRLAEHLDERDFPFSIEAWNAAKEGKQS